MSEPRWIPVGERLPPDEELVLCVDIASDEDGVIDHDFVVAYRINGQWTTARGDKFGGWAMTHWMPPPEPPEVPA